MTNGVSDRASRRRGPSAQTCWDHGRGARPRGAIVLGVVLVLGYLICVLAGLLRAALPAAVRARATIRSQLTSSLLSTTWHGAPHRGREDRAHPQALDGSSPRRTSATP